jgi:stearoyl-CoA desaturase (Delta-9 desaturase)
MIKENFFNLSCAIKKHQLDKVEWKLFIELVYLHLAGIYGILFIPEAKWQTILFGEKFNCFVMKIFGLFEIILVAYLMYQLALLGSVTAVHRYWSHRSFKAKLPLEIFMMLCQTMTFQRSIRTWVRDHRIHHKYSDTAADPHNSNRGFFFCHIGWIFMPKSNELIEAEKNLDVSDLDKDELIKFQYDNYELLCVIFGMIFPTFVPMYFWNETYANSFFLNTLKSVWSMNMTWCINSVSHMFGDRPYDKSIKPTQNAIMSFFNSEGWHNFHHAFPWDYKADEFSGPFRYLFGPSTAFIDFCAWLGLAYDLKVAPKSMIEARKKTKGL